MNSLCPGSYFRLTADYPDGAEIGAVGIDMGEGLFGQFDL